MDKIHKAKDNHLARTDGYPEDWWEQECIGLWVFIFF